MIHFDFDKECTGCKVCADVCPKSCISFEEDSYGFFMPYVDESFCINCHRCEKVCPVLNPKSVAYGERKCYSAFHKDYNIRHKGSSGSVFYELAEHTIKQGGVVYGAALSKDLQLRHTRATNLDDVQKQMKSKYIQSDTGGIYKQVLADLSKGRQILFVGTPCQCKALDNLIPSRLRDKLFIADIICHGVPSQSLFNQSVETFEKQHNCKVIDFSFREKTVNALRNVGITYSTAEGIHKTVIIDMDDYAYCFAYFYHWSIRKSCYKCKLRNVERSSDITLADFWGLDKLRPIPKEDFNKGYSSVIINSERGNRILQTNLLMEEIPEGIEHTIKYNHAYTKADAKSLMRSIFFGLLRHKGFAYCERHILTKHPSLFWRLFKSFIFRIDRINNIYK